MRLVWVLVLVAACADPLVVSAGSGELAVVGRVDFPATAIGFPRVQPLVVTNRSRVSRTVTLSASVPFSAPASVEVPGGADATVDVVFAPLAPGAVTGLLLVDGLEVGLSGEGVAPLDCGAASVCETVRFDPATLSCVRVNKADGTACEDELACIEAGACQAGTCVGRAARCDDANACTTDACAVGRGCQHSTTECAPPSNPCQAALCDPVRGCGTAPVMDGTPCGAVSCALANVCLAGVCRAVEPPEGFTCAPESACRGEGVCRNKTCVIPAERELQPRWSYTAVSSDFRFEGVTDAQGNWYWVECVTTAVRMGTAQEPPLRPGHLCDVHSRTPEGLERFRTPVTGDGPLTGVAKPTQLVSGGLFVFGVNEASLAAIDVATGVVRWHRGITSFTAAAQAVEALADDGRGALWAIVRVDAESSTWTLTRVEVATGRTFVTVARPARVRGLISDGAGRAFVLREDPTSPLPVNPLGIARLERIDPDGSVGFSVGVPAAAAPVMVVGDRVVLADDSVRSAGDGRELEPASSTDWATQEWSGLTSGAGRLRLARSMAMPPLPPRIPPAVIGLQKVDARGARTQPFTVMADQATEAFLTAGGEALFATSGELPVRPVPPTRETRVRQVHPLGLELMSCPLVDQPPGYAAMMPLTLGRAAGFNGRVFAVQSMGDDCNNLCDHADLWTPPRVVFYDLGRPGPGLATTGWVGPRGTPGGTARPR